jgi:hypothetical protein
MREVAHVMVVFGVWLAVAGAIAVVAGLAGARRRRRLQDSGLTAWAMVLPTPSDAGEQEPWAAQVNVQFALEDGRVIERAHGRPVRRSAALKPGERVLVWYDPEDPADVLIYGRDGRWSDRTFLAAGALFVVIGVALTGLLR